MSEMTPEERDLLLQVFCGVEVYAVDNKDWAEDDDYGTVRVILPSDINITPAQARLFAEALTMAADAADAVLRVSDENPSGEDAQRLSAEGIPARPA